jgi:hypothetical protein
MKYYLDFEFVPPHEATFETKQFDVTVTAMTPIQLAIVCENGATYYCPAMKGTDGRYEASMLNSHEFLREHVLPNVLSYVNNRALKDAEIEGSPIAQRCTVEHAHYSLPAMYAQYAQSYAQVRQDLIGFFLDNTPKHDKIELWTYYGAHDMVLFQGLWGNFDEYGANGIGLPFFDYDVKASLERLPKEAREVIEAARIVGDLGNEKEHHPIYDCISTMRLHAVIEAIRDNIGLSTLGSPLSLGELTTRVLKLYNKINWEGNLFNRFGRKDVMNAAN